MRELSSNKAARFAWCTEMARRLVDAYHADAPEGFVAYNNLSPEIPKQNLSKDVGKIFNVFEDKVIPGFNQWQTSRPELAQLQQFIQGTEIPQLTGLLNKFPDPYQTIAPLQSLLNNQPGINQTLGPLQTIMGQLPSAGQFAAPIGGVSQSLQNTFQNLTPVSQLTDPLQARIASLMNVAPTLRRGLATQAPIIASAGETTLDQKHAAQQEAFGNASLMGNAFGNQASLADILNQQKYKDARLQGAIQNVTGMEGIQGQDIAARTALPQAIQQLTGADIANRLGLGQGITQAQQAQQGVYNQDLAARSGLVNLMDQLRSSDVNRRMGLTSGIQNVLGTNLAQRLGLMQGITGAITQPLTTSEQTFMALLSPLMGVATNVFDANQNAGAAQAIAGANTNAGLLSGIISALGNVGGSYLGSLG